VLLSTYEAQDIEEFESLVSEDYREIRTSDEDRFKLDYDALIDAVRYEVDLASGFRIKHRILGVRSGRNGVQVRIQWQMGFEDAQSGDRIARKGVTELGLAHSEGWQLITQRQDPLFGAITSESLEGRRGNKTSPDLVIENRDGFTITTGSRPLLRPDQLRFLVRNLSESPISIPFNILFEWVDENENVVGSFETFTFEGELGTSVIRDRLYDGDKFVFDSDDHTLIDDFVSASNQPDGSVFLRITLDSDNEIIESNEDNNSYLATPLALVDLEHCCPRQGLRS
jgi:hypothetical protein